MKFESGDKVVCTKGISYAMDGMEFFVCHTDTWTGEARVWVSNSLGGEPCMYLNPDKLELVESAYARQERANLNGRIYPTGLMNREIRKFTDRPVSLSDFGIGTSMVSRAVDKARDPYIGQQGGSIIDAYDAPVSGESKKISIGEAAFPFGIAFDIDVDGCEGDYYSEWDTNWKPTEKDYRECCGKYIHRTDHMGRVTTILPDSLSYYWKSRDDFDSLYSSYEWNKIEGIPEQCIPKREEPRESYHVRYPLIKKGLGVD